MTDLSEVSNIIQVHPNAWKFHNIDKLIKEASIENKGIQFVLISSLISNLPLPVFLKFPSMLSLIYYPTRSNYGPNDLRNDSIQKNKNGFIYTTKFGLGKDIPQVELFIPWEAIVSISISDKSFTPPPGGGGSLEVEELKRKAA